MELLERESELQRLRAGGDAARAGSGYAVVVEGEAGIGKTALLAAAADGFERDGIVVLRARGGELERDFGFGVVRQLFEPEVAGVSTRDRGQLFAGAAAFAAPVLGIGAPTTVTAGPDAAFAAQHGLYWLAVNLASSRPLALLVDDAHWADGASLRWLLYLVRRLEGVALSVLIAWRSGEPGTPRELLEVVRSESSVDVVSLSGLSLDATSRLVRAGLGAAAADFCASCHEASGGNPFLTGELVRALVGGDVPADARGAMRVSALGPSAVSRSVLLRLARVSEDARSLARAVAVLDTDAEQRFAAALSRLDSERVAAAAEALVRARIFDDCDVLRFAHPILRAAVYADLPAPRRSAEHRRAAAVLAELGGDPDRAAVHLLATAPAGEARVARSLFEAAARAVGRGAPDAAFALLTRALAEPPGPDERSAVLLARGVAGFMSANPDAETHLRQAVVEAEDPAIRAQAAMTLSQLEVGGGRARAALATLEQAIAELRDDGDKSVQRLELYRITTEAVQGARWVRVQEPLVGLRELAAPGSWLRRVACGCSIWQESLRPDAPRPDAIAALRGELGDPRALARGTGPLDFVYFNWAMMGLEQIDDLDGARAGLDAAAAVAHKAGHLAGLAPVLATRAAVLYGLGQLAAVEADASQALRLGPLVGNNVARDWALASLCMALAERGEFDQAEQALEDQGLADGDPGPTMLEARLLIGRAYLRDAEGQHARACADVARYAARLRGYDGAPFGSLPAVCARILAAGGQEKFAGMLAGRAVEVSAASGVDGIHGMALHAAGLLERGPAAVMLLERAVVVLERSPRTLEHARALTDLGAALRRANRRADAREPLARGMEVAHRCGASTLAERAREELVATGARPRRPVRSGRDALTASELRVAELAAAGHNITEIGQALFVTRKTVETHLYAAYRKLDVSTRAQLAAAMRPDGDDPARGAVTSTAHA
jgi:DNA-binding CsgD family transcriptional regulator